MATTISSGTLNVSIEEDITYDGTRRTTKATHSIASVTDILRRTFTLTTSPVNVLVMAAVDYSAGFIHANVRYVRITNRDNANTVLMNTRAAADNAWFALKPGESFVLWNQPQIDADNSAIASPTLGDIVGIDAKAAANTADIDVVVASV